MNRFAARFIGHYNLLEAEAAQRLLGHQGPGCLAIRPECIQLQPQAQGPARVLGHQLLGNVVRYQVQWQDQRLDVDTLNQGVQGLLEPGTVSDRSVPGGGLMALALFDLDDTLLDGDTASLWFEHMVDRGWADAAMARQEQALMARYYAGTLAMEEYMAFTLSPLAERSLAEVAAEVALCLQERIVPRLYPEAQALLQHYRTRGDRIIIVSASGEHIVRPVARHLGVSEVLAIELEQVADRYTGRTQGVLTYQGGKVTRLRQWLGEELDLLDSHGYSDSINDLPLLELVEFAHVVNPGERLAKLALARGWEALLWRR